VGYPTRSRAARRPAKPGALQFTKEHNSLILINRNFKISVGSSRSGPNVLKHRCPLLRRGPIGDEVRNEIAKSRMMNSLFCGRLQMVEPVRDHGATSSPIDFATCGCSRSPKVVPIEARSWPRFPSLPGAYVFIMVATVTPTGTRRSSTHSVMGGMSTSSLPFVRPTLISKRCGVTALSG
jgi:hypothetical protein